MPVNYQQALQQIREMGKNIPVQQERQKERRALAEKLFIQYACELDSLEQLVERASAENPKLRCARPYRECLNLTVSAAPPKGGYTLLAADGSQINPDRHGMVEFGAINVGVIRMCPGAKAAPEELVRSKLMFQEALYTSAGTPLTVDLVALMRDLAERRELVNLAKAESGPVVALTDGGLELYGEAKGSKEFDDELASYRSVLEELANLNVATGGYVDRPRGDLLVRLLELVLLQQGGLLNRAGIDRPLRWVTDADLFRQSLKPGERSAVFSIQSGSPLRFTGQLAVHYFYLNVGRENHPYLSRVEIPLWVAESELLTNLLHACLLEQAHHLGARPYPYILHRAHEIAVITNEERDQLEIMIAAELRRQGVMVDDRSNKQIAKDSSANR